MKTEQELYIDEEIQQAERRKSFIRFTYRITSVIILIPLLLCALATLFRSIRNDNDVITPDQFVINTQTLASQAYLIEDGGEYFVDDEVFHTIKVEGHTFGIPDDLYREKIGSDGTFETEVYIASFRTTSHWTMDLFAKKELVAVRLSCLGQSNFTQDDLTNLSSEVATFMTNYKYNYLNHKKTILIPEGFSLEK